MVLCIHGFHIFYRLIIVFEIQYHCLQKEIFSLFNHRELLLQMIKDYTFCMSFTNILYTFSDLVTSACGILEKNKKTKFVFFFLIFSSIHYYVLFKKWHVLQLIASLNSLCKQICFYITQQIPVFFKQLYDFQYLFLFLQYRKIISNDK